MPITSNSVQNNQNQSGGMNTSAARRTYRAAGSTVIVREGETLKGVVSDIHGKEITISMEDGSSFTGKLPEASQYSIGQKAAFLITSLENGTIYMKAMSEAYLLGMEDTMEQALEEAGLPKSPRNLEIVRSLLNNQQSISRQNILDSLQLCAKYPDANVNTVITMRRLGMSMDAATVSQFDHYQNQNHQLLYRMDTLADSVNELLSDLAGENPEVARYAANETLNTILNSLPSLEEFTLASEHAALINNPAGEAELPAEDGTETAQAAAPGQESASTNAAPAGEDIIPSPFTRMKELLTGITERALTGSGENTAASEFIPEQTGSILLPKERAALSELVGKYVENEPLLSSLENGELTARELLTEIKNTLASLPDDAVRDLFTAKEFQKVMKGQLMAGWTISPDGLKEKGGIDNLYNKMQEQINDLTTLSRMFATRTSGENVINTTTDMQQNMEFMKMLNEQFAYMQLPLKLSEENAHGDLYVMTRKDALKKSKDNLRVLLHLEMDSLGTLDIHIKKENTSISTKFYVAKEPARKLLEKNAELLKDAINAQGYAFTSEFLEKEKDIDLVKDFIEHETPAPVGNLTRYNFDLRA